MTIACPTLQWPSGLLEAGPEHDRTILLRSVAEIAGASYSVIAIRIDPIRMAADLRSDVPAHTYSSHQVQNMLDDLLEYTEITDQSLVRLSTGSYVLVMIPAGGD